MSERRTVKTITPAIRINLDATPEQIKAALGRLAESFADLFKTDEQRDWDEGLKEIRARHPEWVDWDEE